jgi:endogenous inhibitor of DNA gyrase (YacG/DUF329 family)
MTARKYTHCSTCGTPLPRLKPRKGRFYKWCSADCRRADRAGYWHNWYVANVKSTKAAARTARAAAGYRTIERRARAT